MHVKTKTDAVRVPPKISQLDRGRRSPCYLLKRSHADRKTGKTGASKYEDTPKHTRGRAQDDEKPAQCRCLSDVLLQILHEACQV